MREKIMKTTTKDETNKTNEKSQTTKTTTKKVDNRWVPRDIYDSNGTWKGNITTDELIAMKQRDKARALENFDEAVRVAKASGIVPDIMQAQIARTVALRRYNLLHQCDPFCSCGCGGGFPEDSEEETIEKLQYASETFNKLVEKTTIENQNRIEITEAIIESLEKLEERVEKIWFDYLH